MLQNFKVSEIIRNIITSDLNKEIVFSIAAGTSVCGLIESLVYYQNEHKLPNLPIGFVKDALPITNIISNLIFNGPILYCYVLCWPVTVPLTQLFYIGKNIYKNLKK